MLVAQSPAAEEPTHQAPVADTGIVVDKNPKDEVVPDAEGKSYFPKGRESYYTAYYRAANLPSLQSLRLNKGEVRFRVAFLPSFSNPLFLSYSRDKTGGLISVARLSGRCVLEDQPGTVELQGAVRIKPENADAFEKIAVLPEVRDPLKALDPRLLPLFNGLDGQRWILEVLTSEGYTMVDIQSPESFKYIEGEVRKHFENEIRKDPQRYELPESFKKYGLPDLDVSVFATFCSDVLKAADVSIPIKKGDERPTYRAE